MDTCAALALLTEISRDSVEHFYTEKEQWACFCNLITYEENILKVFPEIIFIMLFMTWSFREE